MSYTIKAAALSRAHLGALVTINRGDLRITDTLRSVSHEADLIDDRHVFAELPAYVCGRIQTTLGFANAGSVQVAGDDDVRVEA